MSANPSNVHARSTEIARKREEARRERARDRREARAAKRLSQRVDQAIDPDVLAVLRRQA